MEKNIPLCLGFAVLVGCSSPQTSDGDCPETTSYMRIDFGYGMDPNSQLVIKNGSNDSVVFSPTRDQGVYFEKIQKFINTPVSIYLQGKRPPMGSDTLRILPRLDNQITLYGSPLDSARFQSDTTRFRGDSASGSKCFPLKDSTGIIYGSFCRAVFGCA